MEAQKELENTSSMKPIDLIPDSLFEKITEEEKDIACKFCLNEKDIRALYRKTKCVVRVDYANLLNGIEKKILKREPQLKNSKKLLIAAYKWHQSHLRSSKKYCNKAFQQLSEDNIVNWRNRKVHDLMTLGIHPKLLATTYKKDGNFNKAIKYLEECDLKHFSSPAYPVLVCRSDSESENSIITVINTQESEYIAITNEHLININQNYVNENNVLKLEELIINSSQNVVNETFEENEINTDELFNPINCVNKNTEKNAINTEELINISQNYVNIGYMNFVFNSQTNEINISEEIIEDVEEINKQPIFESQPPQSYDQFNYDGMMLTSTQKI